MRALLLIPALLAGCAMTPQDMAAKSTYDVCRLSMGGPFSRMAEYEAARRGIDCRPMYGAIAAQEGASNAAVMNLSRQLMTPAPMPPRTINCQSYRLGNTIATDCN